MLCGSLSLSSPGRWRTTVDAVGGAPVCLLLFQQLPGATWAWLARLNVAGSDLGSATVALRAVGEPRLLVQPLELAQGAGRDV